MPGNVFTAAARACNWLRAVAARKWGHLADGTAAERILIYGSGPAARQFVASLVDWRHVSAIGFVDGGTRSRRTLDGLPVWSDASLSRVLRQTRPDRVVIADPNLPERMVLDLAWRVTAAGRSAETAAEFLERMYSDEAARRLIGTLIDAPRQPPTEPFLHAPSDDITGRSILVTGAGGTIGSEICAQLIGLSAATVVMVDHCEYALCQIDRRLAAPAEAAGVRLIAALGSVNDPTFINDVIERHATDVILHAAAYKHVNIVEENPRAGIINNTLGTATIAQKARERRVSKFVLISTDKAVRPSSVMGASKRLAELVVQDLADRSDSTTFSIVRFGNVAGSSGSVLPLFREQIARGGPVTLTHPEATRYFMTVEQAAQLVLAAARLSVGGEMFALDMGPPIRIRDIARRLIEASGHSVRDADRPQGDIEILTIGLRPGEKLHETRLVRADRVPTGHPRIFIVPEIALTEIQVAGLLRDMRDAADSGNEDRLRAVVGHWLDVERRMATDGAFRTGRPSRIGVQP